MVSSNERAQHTHNMYVHTTCTRNAKFATRSSSSRRTMKGSGRKGPPRMDRICTSEEAAAGACVARRDGEKKGGGLNISSPKRHRVCVPRFCTESPLLSTFSPPPPLLSPPDAMCPPIHQEKRREGFPFKRQGEMESPTFVLG